MNRREPAANPPRTRREAADDRARRCFGTMDDLGFGRLIRLARIRRGWRQQDLADHAGASRAAVSRLERGRIGELPLDLVRKVAAQLDIRVEAFARARAIDIDRVVNARHTALAEFVVRWIGSMPGWIVRAEVSFSEYGERGVIDLLSWHEATRALLVIELKTEFVDFGELLAVLGMKHRLGSVVARQFGWKPASVSSCLLIADSMTNRRRAADHAALLASAFQQDGRELLRWLKAPAGSIRALRFVTDARPGSVRSGFAGRTRVRPPRVGRSKGGSRSTPTPPEGVPERDEAGGGESGT
ncbi:MAG: helix-turn-helix transcriptional regulator [Chloroflexota bacterium]